MLFFSILFGVHYFFFSPSEVDLLPKIEGATQVRIESRQKNYGESYFVLNDPAEIRDLIGNIKLARHAIGDRCACEGNPVFVFYKGPQLLAEVGFKHGTHIYCSGDKEDGLLTKASADYLKKLLKSHGLTETDFL